MQILNLESNLEEYAVLESISNRFHAVSPGVEKGVI